MKNEFGKTIIDELKICYTANQTLLDELKTIPMGHEMIIGDLSFYRNSSHHFMYSFVVCAIVEEVRTKIATAQFERYGDNSDCGFFFYRLENRVLYDPVWFKFSLSVPDMLSLSFHNISSMDLAIDTKTDTSLLIKRMIRRDDVTTIVNGKAVNDRSQLVTNMSFVYSTTLDRLKGLTVYVKQSKAAHDKTKGVTVQSYNKNQEIETCSQKEYIREYYGNPKRLYRLEVHLNNAEIKDYCKSHNVMQSIDTVEDENVLSDMFYYHLSSVLRFTKGRTKLDWKTIIACNGRV